MVLMVFLACSAKGMETDKQRLTDGLSSRDSNVRKEAFDRLVAERKARISALLRVLKEAASDRRERLLPHRGSKLHLTMKLLGELRAVEAIPSLIGLIEYEPLRKEDLPLALQFPAVQALIKIGRPSVDAVIEGLRTGAMSPQRSMLCTLVVVSVEGKAAGRVLLEGAVRDEKDAEGKAGLRVALQHLAKFRRLLATEYFTFPGEPLYQVTPETGTDLDPGDGN